MLLWAEETIPNATIGWVAAVCLLAITGAFALLLRWLLFTHLPAKDQQIKDLIADFRSERNFDRESRHKTANEFQAALGVVSEMAEKHQDRQMAAFAGRNSELKEAIRDQTGILGKALEDGLARVELAMGTVCEADALRPRRHTPDKAK